jgi:hypothetical protein
VNDQTDDLEALLPEASRDTVTPEMAGPRTQGRFVLAEGATYEYFEARRERFGWFRDPSRAVVEVVDVGLRPSRGRAHWSILLRHGRGGWRVDKAMACDSLASARTLAAMEWAGRMGYLIGYVDGRPQVGPHISDLADPARYLDLAKAVRNSGTSGGGRRP